MSFLSDAELKKSGFQSIGANVKISSKAVFYGAEFINIGDNVRIDDFAILSAGEDGIDVGAYVHIAPFCLLAGAARISLGRYSGLSSRVSIYSSTDDYSGEWMTNPCVPNDLRNVHSEAVLISEHCIIGASSVVLPGSQLGEACAVGSLSFVHGTLQAYSIYAGSPVKRLRDRSSNCIQLAINSPDIT